MLKLSYLGVLLLYAVVGRISKLERCIVLDSWYIGILRIHMYGRCYRDTYKEGGI